MKAREEKTFRDPNCGSLNPFLSENNFLFLILRQLCFRFILNAGYVDLKTEM